MGGLIDGIKEALIEIIGLYLFFEALMVVTVLDNLNSQFQSGQIGGFVYIIAVMLVIVVPSIPAVILGWIVQNILGKSKSKRSKKR